MHSYRKNSSQQGGMRGIASPPSKMLGGMHPPSPPPLTPVYNTCLILNLEWKDLCVCILYVFSLCWAACDKHLSSDSITNVTDFIQYNWDMLTWPMLSVQWVNSHSWVVLEVAVTNSSCAYNRDISFNKWLFSDNINKNNNNNNDSKRCTLHLFSNKPTTKPTQLNWRCLLCTVNSHTGIGGLCKKKIFIWYLKVSTVRESLFTKSNPFQTVKDK